MSPPPIDPQVLAPFAMAGLFGLLLDAAMLASGWSPWHAIAVPVRRGEDRLAVPLLPDSDLPADSTGPTGRWLDGETVAFWSGRVRFGFRGGRFLPARLPLGVMVTGVARLTADRTCARWTLGLRPGPVVLLIAVAAMAVVALELLGSGGFAVLSVAFFAAFYFIFAVIAGVLSGRARRAVLGPLAD